MIAILPNKVPPYLLESSCGPYEWNYKWKSLWHNHRVISTNLPDIDNLKPHQTIGLLVTTEGHLHVYLNGQHIKKVAIHVPVDHNLWGAVDVHGSCSKIKSELRSGKLVFVCTQYQHKYYNMYMLCTTT